MYTLYPKEHLYYHEDEVVTKVYKSLGHLSYYEI